MSDWASYPAPLYCNGDMVERICFFLFRRFGLHWQNHIARVSLIRNGRTCLTDKWMVRSDDWNDLWSSKVMLIHQNISPSDIQWRMFVEWKLKNKFCRYLVDIKALVDYEIWTHSTWGSHSLMIHCTMYIMAHSWVYAFVSSCDFISPFRSGVFLFFFSMTSIEEKSGHARKRCLPFNLP